MITIIKVTDLLTGITVSLRNKNRFRVRKFRKEKILLLLP